MAYFPFFIDIEDKNCLIVGGGEVAYRKARSILEFGSKIMIVAPKICENLKKLSEQNEQVHWIRREFCERDLEQISFVIASTDNREVNETIFELCTAKNILVNVVDEKEQCSFFFPSLVKKKDVVIGISSGGKSPVLSQKIRKNIEKIVPDYYGKLNDELGNMREKVKDKFETMEEKKAYYEDVIREFEEKEKVEEKTK